MTTQTPDDGPVTFTLTGETWHLVLRELVYAATTMENVRGDVIQGADPKQDAWVLAVTQRLENAVKAQDRALELLHDARTRPVFTI